MMMKKILLWVLAPAVSLLKRLSYPAKFGLIGVLAVVTMGFFMLSLAAELRSDLSLAQREQEGLAVHSLSLSALQQSATYAGLAVGSKGSAALQPLAAAALKRADPAFEKVRERLRDAEDLGLSARWTEVEGKWQAYKTQVASSDVRTLAGGFEAVERSLQDFMRELGDASALSRHPSAKGAYLAEVAINRVPDVLRRMAQIGNTGIMVLGVPDLSREWRRMSNMNDELNGAQDELVATMLRAFGGESKSVSETGKRLAAVTGKYSAFVKQNVLSGVRTMPPQAFADSSAKALGEYFGLIEDDVVGELRSVVRWRVMALSLKYWGMNLVALLMVLLLAYTAISMYLSISDTVAALADGTRRVGEGELSHRIVLDSQDELGKVATQFNGMIDALERVVTGVEHAAGEVTEVARSLVGGVSKASSGAGTQSEASAQMAATIEEMTVGINEISRFSMDAERISSDSGRVSQDGERIVEQTEREIERISEAVRQSSSVIDELVENSEKISAIVTTIKEIAEQTNLLALNAAIEAARAGETGRGFAVVADEIRKLADRTTRATEQITQQILAIQDGTNQAVSSMQKGVDRVAEGVALTRQTGDAMRGIQQSSRAVVELVSSISLALREQSSTSGDVAQSIERVAGKADQINAVAQESLETAARLDELSGGLDEQLKQLRRT